jgi:hypothetical protein
MHVACRRLRDRLDPDKGCSTLCATLPDPSSHSGSERISQRCDKDELSKQQKQQQQQRGHDANQAPVLFRYLGPRLGEALARLGPAELLRSGAA